MDLASRPRRLARGFAFTAVATAVALLSIALPAAARAAQLGFGTPRILTPPGVTADEPLAVVAPNGRTAIFERSGTGKGAARQIHDQAWLGPDPDHLTGPADVPGATTGQDLQAAAEPDGTIVACYTPEDTNPYTLTCALAPPGGGFGAPRLVASTTNTPIAEKRFRSVTYQVLALADGRLALLTGHSDDGRNTAITLALAPAGTLAFTPPAPVPGDGSGGFAPLPDGGLMRTYATGDEAQGTLGRAFAQVLAPGASAFSAPVAVTPPRTASGIADAQTGRYGVAIRTVKQRKNAPEQLSASIRKPGGAGWTAPVPLRAVTDGFINGDVLFTPDRRPLVISDVAHESETDCGQQTLGRIGAAPLIGAAPMLVSNKHQIANLEGDRVLDDGTVVVIWTDSADAERVEYAVRAPHARRFGPGHPLPITAAREVEVAGDGRHVVAAWITGSLPDGPSRLVLATSRTAPPYAPTARRPAHPSAPCG